MSDLSVHEWFLYREKWGGGKSVLGGACYAVLQAFGSIVEFLEFAWYSRGNTEFLSRWEAFKFKSLIVKGPRRFEDSKLSTEHSNEAVHLHKGKTLFIGLSFPSCDLDLTRQENISRFTGSKLDYNVKKRSQIELWKDGSMFLRPSASKPF